MQQDLEGGEQGHEKCGALAARELAQRRREVGRYRELDRPAVVGLHVRAHAVGRQLERRRRSGEPRAPVPDLLLECGALEPLALPHGEIRVLDRQRGERGRAARHEGVVEGRQLAEQQAVGPAVRDDVVHVEQQQVLVGTAPHQRGAGERPADEIERGDGVVAHQPRDLGLARRRRQDREVDERQREGGRRGDELHRLAAALGEGGAQRFVTARDFAQGTAQQRHTQLSVQPRCARHVVGRSPRLELVEEPQPLLRERQRR